MQPPTAEARLSAAWLRYLLDELDLLGLTNEAALHIDECAIAEFAFALATTDVTATAPDVHDLWRSLMVNSQVFPAPDDLRGQALQMLRLTLAGDVEAGEALRSVRELSLRDGARRIRTMADFDGVVGIASVWEEYTDQREALFAALVEEAQRLAPS